MNYLFCGFFCLFVWGFVLGFFVLFGFLSSDWRRTHTHCGKVQTDSLSLFLASQLCEPCSLMLSLSRLLFFFFLFLLQSCNAGNAVSFKKTPNPPKGGMAVMALHQPLGTVPLLFILMSFCSGLVALLVPLYLCTLVHLPSQGQAGWSRII